MAARIRKALFFCAALIAVLFALKLLYSAYGGAVPCLIHSVTGLYCPGCGSTRALIALSELDFYQALRYNAYFTLCIPFLVAAGLRSVYNFVRYGFISKVGSHDAIVAVALVVVALFFTLTRNLNLFAFLAPTAVR